MKRIIYVLGVILLFSVSLNVVYEIKTHKFERKIYKMRHSKVPSDSKVPSEKILATYNNKPVKAVNGIYGNGKDSTISIVF